MRDVPTGRICYSTNFDLSLPNGPGTNEQQFVMSMDRLLGDKVVFVLPTPADVLPGDFPTAHCTYYESGARRPFGRIAAMIRKTLLLRRIDKAGDVDMFVFRIGVFPLAELAIALTSKRPVFIKTFGPRTVEVFREMRFWIRFLAPLNRAITSLLLQRAAAIDVVSDIHKESVCALYKLPDSKVNVVDNAVDVGRFRPRAQRDCRQSIGLPEDEAIIGYVGNQALIRGGVELIKSVATLEQRGTRIVALIVSGDQAGIADLRALADELGVSDKILFRGPVRLDEVPRYIGALDVAISMREDDGCSELKVRQYIACGRPVVVSAAVNKFVDAHDLGSVIDRSDPEQLAQAIAYWLNRVKNCDAAETLANRLHRYASENLDFDFANSRRLKIWARPHDIDGSDPFAKLT